MIKYPALKNKFLTLDHEIFGIVHTFQIYELLEIGLAGETFSVTDVLSRALLDRIYN